MSDELKQGANSVT